MRRAAALGLMLAMAAVACLLLANRTPELDSLYQDHDWFHLRDAVLQMQGAPAFHRAAVAFAFRDWDRAEKEIRPLLSSKLDLAKTVHANEWLFKMYLLTGRYRQASRQLDTLWRVLKDRWSPFHSWTLYADTKGTYELYHDECEILRRYDDMSVARRGYSRIPYAELDNSLVIPLSIDGKPANYSFDTGSNESSISETEAHRLGLAIHEVEVPTNGTATRGIAMAHEVNIGQFRLRNVELQVMADEDMTDDGGILGMPVLLALGPLRWNSDGTLELGFETPPATLRDANIWYDSELLVAEAGFGGSKLGLLLDTGSYETVMHPRFLMEFAKQVRPGKREKHPHSGIGSSVELDAAVLPALTLGLGSFPASLSAGHHVFLRETPYQELMPLHGQLGIDLLGQSQSVTLDFNAMRLVLDGSPPAASEAKTCVLPPRFACQRGWTCTVKADPEVHCMIDRSPDTPWPGNPLSDEASDDGDAEICRYTLPKQFTCEEGSTCIVVFRGAGHVEKIPRGGYRPASPVSSQ